MKIREYEAGHRTGKRFKGQKAVSAKSDHYHNAGGDDRGSGYLNYAGKRDLEAEAVYPRQEAWSFRGRPDGGKPGGTVRNGFGHFKSGQ